MAVDGDEGNKAEEQPGFLAQLQAVLGTFAQECKQRVANAHLAPPTEPIRTILSILR